MELLELTTFTKPNKFNKRRQQGLFKCKCGNIAKHVMSKQEYLNHCLKVVNNSIGNN